jgi:hypothetical protein
VQLISAVYVVRSPCALPRSEPSDALALEVLSVTSERSETFVFLGVLVAVDSS